MNKIYQTHVVAYIDILGFKSALEDDDMAKRLLDILQRIKGAENKNCDINIKEDEKQTEIQISPIITAFSDCIVISVPKIEIKERVSYRYPIIEILNIFMQLFILAINAGYLLRGGISIGELYHRDGIVFGPALNDAYILESQKAKDPRIIACKDLVDLFVSTSNNVDRTQYFKMDKDGFYYLDFLPHMFPLLDNSDREKIPKILKKNIDNLNKLKKDKELKKWEWFSEYYQQAMSSKERANRDLTSIL